MLIHKIFLLVLLAQTPAPKGSISGTVVDAVSGTALGGADIYMNPGGKSAKTDDKGNYEFKDLDSGTYKLTAYQGQGAHGSQVAHVASGQNVTLDFRLTTAAEISGKVTDENGEPVPGANVFLIAREYRLGALRYVYARLSNTDDRGVYHLKNVDAGTGYLIEAVKQDRYLRAISDAPADPKLRKRATVPTFYPNGESVAAGQVLVLAAGEKRDGMDISLRRSAAYCLDGVLATERGPAPLRFSIEQSEPSSGASGDGAMYMNPPSGMAGADGRIRICDLHPGVYRLEAYDALGEGLGFFGETEVAVGDKDVHKVSVVGRAKISVRGEVAWDGKPPDQPVTGKIRLTLEPMTRAFFGAELNATHPPPLAVPGEFALQGVLADDYLTKTFGIPDGIYVKDILYGGQSALREPIHAGKTMGTDLRIMLGTDGGKISLKTQDKDGNAIPECTVVLFPDTANSEAALADSMIPGQTDQYGAYTSATIAPGSYYVLATGDAVNRTPESIGKLMRARTQAQKVDLKAGGSAAVTLLPVSLQ